MTVFGTDAEKLRAILDDERHAWFETERARLGLGTADMVRFLVDFARRSPRAVIAEARLVAGAKT